MPSIFEVIAAKKAEQERARREAERSAREDPVRRLLAEAPQYQSTLETPEFERLRGEAFGEGPLSVYEAARKQARLQSQRAIEDQSREGASAVQNAYSQLAMGGGLSSGARERIASGGGRQSILARQGLRGTEMTSLADIGTKEAAEKLAGQKSITDALTAERQRKNDFAQKNYELRAQVEGGLAKSAAEKQIAETNASACFSPDTMIAMHDGSEKPISEIRVGDKVLGGGDVYSVIQTRAPDEIYHYAGSVFVTAMHAVCEGGTWMRVQDATLSVKCASEITTVWNLATDKHRIVIKGITFADFHETDDFLSLTNKGSIAALNGEGLEEECSTQIL